MPAMRDANPRGSLVHTGQHYDPQLNSQFFEALGIAEDINLDVGSGSHVVQPQRSCGASSPSPTRSDPGALLVVGERARDKLLRDGITAQRIHFVGNVMIDTLRHSL